MSPAQLIGRTEKPKSAVTSATAPSTPGKTTPGMEDLESDPGQPGEEEQRDDVRVDEDVEEAREEARLRVDDLRVRGVERDVAAVGLVSVETIEQRAQVGCLEVDHVQLERLIDGQVRRCAHGAGGPVAVPAVRLRKGP